MNRANILIVPLSDADGLSRALQQILAAAPDFIVQVRSQEEVCAAEDDGPTEAKQRPGVPDLERAELALIVASRPRLRQITGIVSSLKNRKADMPVLLVNETNTFDEIREYFKIGVSDYITPPLQSIDVLPRIWRLVEYARERATPTHTLKRDLGLGRLIGKSTAFLAVVEKIPSLAQYNVNVHICGETGTGKELCARAIHYLGPRAGRPFLPVNCGAIPAELVENELFGHARGAFTGAVTASDGLIGEANGGTLFLDEIDCLPLAAQVKLLRLLQEKEYRQIGSAAVRKADVRVVAATNADLDKAVQEGTFRRDLYYRLDIARLALPPLRERAGDIPLLAGHFLEEAATEFARQATEFSPEAIMKLSRYDWPGNVRELENVVKRAVIFSKGNLVRPEEIDLPAELYPAVPESFQAEKAKVIAEFEKKYIQNILQTHQGNITQAANAAGKNRRAFWELLRKHNIDAQNNKPFLS